MEKILPHSIEAEQGIIAGILLDEDFVRPFVLGLNSNRFYRAAHRVIFDAQLSLLNKKIAVDMVSLGEELGAKLDGIGGLDYIINLVEQYPSALNVEEYIRIIEEKHSIRQIIKHATDTANEGYSGTLSVENFLSHQKTLIETLHQGTTKKYDLTAAITKTLDLIESGSQRGLSTGFALLDGITGGLIPTDLIVVGGRPSMGKTALIVCMISSLLFANKRVLFFSLEMSTPKIINRIFSIRTGINLSSLKSGKKLERDEWAKLTEAGGTLSNQKLIIDDRPSISTHDIRKAAYVHHLKTPIDVIFIDYLQRMKHSQHKSGNRAYEVGETVIGLKSLAKNLNIPVVLLSQLNRETHNRKIQEPRLSDLRESGDIEQEADLVIFPWRPEETGENGENELIIAKHRDGAKATIKIEWRKETAEFRNLWGRINSSTWQA